MRQLFSVCILVVASYSFAQTASQSPSQALESITNTQIQLAQSEIQRISGLVTAGVLPPARLEQAQEDLRDIQDNALLTRALYAGALIQNLDEQTAEDMLAAAERRVDRQQRGIEQQQKLVESGVVALSFLTPLQDELKKRQFDLDIAKQRVDLVREVANAARLEQSLEDAQNAEMPGALSAGMEHFDGAAPFVEARDLRPIESAFEKKFGSPLPISADGETAVHRALGFDHRGRVDVALNPEAREGVWLRQYLKSHGIPYYAFTRPLAGKATGAHIHIGPGSARLRNAD